MTALAYCVLGAVGKFSWSGSALVPEQMSGFSLAFDNSGANVGQVWLALGDNEDFEPAFTSTHPIRRVPMVSPQGAVVTGAFNQCNWDIVANASAPAGFKALTTKNALVVTCVTLSAAVPPLGGIARNGFSVCVWELPPTSDAVA